MNLLSNRGEGTGPRRLLLLVSSPSDLVEMSDLSALLAGRGHQVVLAYVCESGSASVGEETRSRLLSADGLDGRLQACFIDLAPPAPNLRSPAAANSAVDTGEAVPLIDRWGRALWKRYEARLGRGRLNRFAKRVLLGVRSVLMAPQEGRLPGRRLLLRYRSGLRLRFPTVHGVLASAYLLNYYARHLEVFRTELRAQPYDALLIPEDVVGAVWPIAIKAANELAIPSLVFPYTLANQQEAVQSLKDEPAFQTKNNRLAAWLAPRWRWKRDGLDLVRLPAGHIAAHEWLKISPPDPWLMNSGYASAICVDSQASRSYFARAGIPAEKLTVTGSVSQDHLFAELQNKPERLAALRRELGLVGEKPLLLISGCPNQLAGKVPYCEFVSIEGVAEHVGRALAPLADAYHLVVRPHPNFVAFGELLRPWGITPTAIPTSRLVPLADLFVAFASATIRWSVACAVPTINYDVFNYCYGDFAEAKGVVTVTGAADFVRAVRAMEPQSESYRAAKTLIDADAAYWSMTDGRCAQRIEAAINAVCRQRREN